MPKRKVVLSDTASEVHGPKPMKLAEFELAKGKSRMVYIRRKKQKHICYSLAAFTMLVDKGLID